MARVRSPSAAARKRKAGRRKRHPDTIRQPGGETALALFAHEVRTALTGMLAFGELLATADLGPREREWAAGVRSAAEHLGALAMLVVDAAKAGAARLPLRAERFRPRLVAEAAAASLSARAAAKNLAAAITIADDLPELVRGDAVRLRAALENLIDNAVKFTDAGSVGLTVSAERLPRRKVRLVFVVSDSGLGLDRAALRRLFRPYAQANADIARRYGGAGLGLAAVKRIAGAMGGDLVVASVPGEGSRFRLDVVVARAQEAKRRSPAKLAVLCIADNPFGRVILDTILTELGHTAALAPSGEAAAAMLARGGFDAVLIDVALLELGAAEAARRIRALPGRAGGIPIIGVTGPAGPEGAAGDGATGIDRYLRRPLGPQSLAQALHAVLARRSSAAARTGRGRAAAHNRRSDRSE